MQRYSVISFIVNKNNNATAISLYGAAALYLSTPSECLHPLSILIRETLKYATQVKSGFIGREEAPPGSKHQACVTLRLVLQLRKVWGGEWEEGPRNEEMLTRGRSGAKVASVGR